jgi:hypothetical protein
MTLLWVGCSNSAPPQLLPVNPATVGVNESLTLSLAVQNEAGLALSWSFQGPELAGLAQTASLTGHASGAEFRWTPLASHVGTHQFDFIASSDAGSAKTSVLITVIPQAAAAPVFIQPGKGGTFDMDALRCINFDLEVKDDDSEQVGILAAEPLPLGAELHQKGKKRARFDWCPSDEQIDQSLSWVLHFQADDGDHPPTPHNYQVILRRSAPDNCPGTPPQINVISPAEGDLLASAVGFEVIVKITDAESAVRDQPILHYTYDDPGVDSSLGNFELAKFEEDGETWSASVPPLPGTTGQTLTVWYVVSVVDNDDTAGTECDHSAETPTRVFLAQPIEGTTVADCALCSESVGCNSGSAAPLASASPSAMARAATVKTPQPLKGTQPKRVADRTGAS